MVEYRLTEYETSMTDQETFSGFYPVEEGLPFYLFLTFTSRLVKRA